MNGGYEISTQAKLYKLGGDKIRQTWQQHPQIQKRYRDMGIQEDGLNKQER